MVWNKCRSAGNTHHLCWKLGVGRDRWILGKGIACAGGKTVPNGFTLQKVMACHRLRTAKHSAAAHALSGSRMGTGRKRVRKGHVEQQRGRKGPPPSLLLQTSVWVSDTTLNLHTGPLLSQLARGLLDSRQLARPQSSHLGQAAVLCAQLNPLLASPSLPKDGICFPRTGVGMLMSVLEPASLQLAQGPSGIEQFYGYISITGALPLSLCSFLCNYEKTHESLC